MKLENRLPAEGINASHEHPLKEFAWLVGGVIACIVALALAIAYTAQWIAPRIPFEYEARLVQGLDLTRPPAAEAGRAVQGELQALADRLAARMDMPGGMKVRVGYRDSDAVNAFATLGGQTVVLRGLLVRLTSEDALAMVLAHELAHLKHRHPVAALGRGLAFGLVLSVVSPDLGRAFGGDVLGHAGMLTLLKFSRDQERDADEDALRALAAEYGHLGGAVELFEAFRRLSAASGSGMESVVPEFMRTHPHTGARAERVEQWARMHGVPWDGRRRPLPPAIAALQASEEKPAPATGPAAAH